MLKQHSLKVSPEELLAGASITYETPIPPEILYPGSDGNSGSYADEKAMVVELKPLTIGVFQLIMKAAKNDPGLIPLLMVKEAMVDPKLSLDQIKGMHVGLLKFLVEQVRKISGLTEKKSP